MLDSVNFSINTGASPQSIDNCGRSPLQLAESKLKVLQMDKSRSSRELKNEASQVPRLCMRWQTLSAGSGEFSYFLNVLGDSDVAYLPSKVRTRSGSRTAI